VPGALDDGPGGMGRRRRDFGEKPKLWDVWVDEHGQFHEGSSDHGYDIKDEGKWESILPVSATIRPCNDGKTTAASNDNEQGNVSLDMTSRRPFFSRVLSRRTGLSATQQERNESAAELGTVAPTIPLSPAKEDDVLQVSVFISMPNPNARRMHGSESDVSFKGKERGSGYDDVDGEGELPDVVFGVAEVNLRP